MVRQEIWSLRTVIFTTIALLIFLYSCNQRIEQDKTTGFDTQIISNSSTLQESKEEAGKSHNEIKKFIPNGYSVLDTISGDLNLNKISDKIIVLKKNGEDSLSDVINNPEKRQLLILLRDSNNELSLARKNNNTVYCFDCGGMMGDPYMGVTINNGYFTIEHYGGSSWRWTRMITYKYSKQDNEWYLHKDISKSFHTSEPEIVEGNIRTTKEFGKVKFEEFDIYEDE